MAKKKCSECGAELRLRPTSCPLCGAEAARPPIKAVTRVDPVEPVDVEDYQAGLRDLREQLRKLRDGAQAV